MITVENLITYLCCHYPMDKKISLSDLDEDVITSEMEESKRMCDLMCGGIEDDEE